MLSVRADGGAADSSAAAATTVSAADVVVCGLSITVPLMSAEMLKFPALCSSYMKLITHLSELYPDKVCSMSDDLLASLCVSIELGLTSKYPCESCLIAMSITF